MIDAMPEAVLVSDAGGAVRIVNPAADRLFRGRPVRSVADVLSTFDAPIAEPLGEEAVGIRLRHRPGRQFELRAFPIERGDGARGPGASDAGGRILVLTDVTSAGEERAQRSAFLSILSHELRTPITTIYAGSRVLARRAGTPRASHEIAADISAEAARLYDVVEDLLVLTRAEQGILELSEEPVHLKRIVEGAIRIAAGRAPNVPIVFAGAPDPPAVIGDNVYVEQVIRNLVSAASRYGGPGAPVVVRIATTGNEVAVSVVDRGPKPSDEDLAAAFELAGESAGARATTAGIGLFVCRRLVEAMNGRIWFRRAGGNGDLSGAEYGFALPRYSVPD